MVLHGYADYPCSQWDSNPQLTQYISWPWITPDSRHLNPLRPHDQNREYKCSCKKCTAEFMLHAHLDGIYASTVSQIRNGLSFQSQKMKMRKL